jgi:3-phenylpropionate/trans-cinnamate dioxygenase ferredoxin reductase subunit
LSRTVIVGASVAGLAAARGLRHAGYEGEIVLVGDEHHLPYDRPPLSKQVLSGEWGEDRIWMCDREALADLHVELRAGVRASRVDVGARTVALSTGGDLAFDDLVIATGVRPRLPAAWAAVEGVSVLRTLDDVRLLRAELPDATHVVVVGAGFIGAEAAAVVAGPDRVVTTVDPLPLPMAGALPPALAGLLASVHREHGVDVRCGTAVEEILAADRRVTDVRLSDGSRIKADLVIVGLGATPNTDWLEGSGVPVDDGVTCDEHNRACEHVYAAGDVASWVNPRFSVRMRVEHRMHAAEQAMHVAQTIARGPGDPFAPIPFFWSDQFDLRIQAFGHLRPTDALDVVEGSLEERRLVGTCTRDGRVVAVIGVNMPRQTRGAQELIA